MAEAEQSRESASGAAERSRDAFDPIASRAASSALELPQFSAWSSGAWDSWSLDDETNLGLRFAYGGVLIPNRDQRLRVECGIWRRSPYSLGDFPCTTVGISCMMARAGQPLTASCVR